MDFARVTIRKSGKCHPAIQYKHGDLVAVCSCPGSQNGAVVVGKGHDLVNCRPVK